MKRLLLKQLTTKRLILLVLSFFMLMPSTAWGEEYTYDSNSFSGWDGNAGMYSCLTIDFQNSTTVYSPDQFSNISKVEIVAGGASQIYSSFAVSVNGSDYQSIVSTTGNGYVIPSNVDYDTYTFEFTPEETPQYIKISAQYDAMSGTQGWVYIQSVTVYYTEEKKTTEFYAALSDDGKTVTFYYDDQKKSRGGQNIFSTLDRFYAEATTAVIDKSMAKYAPADMTTWFLNCSALTSITGLENLNTTEVRNMQSLFQGCSSLTSLDLTCFDTSNLINMNGMFAYCSSLKTVDLSSFNTSKVTDMGGLFAYCSDLETIYVDETRWSTAAVTSENNGNSGLFYECGPLVGGNGTAYYDTYDTDGEDLEYARVDKPGQPGYLTHKSAVENDPEPYAVLSNENTVLTFYYDGKKKNRHGLSVGPFTVDFPLSGMQSWADACSSVTSVVFDASFANCTSITSTAGWFFGFRNLKTITGIENLKTDNVKDMSFMFYACSNLTSLDVSSFNTANVTKMVYMFGCCSSLTSLDLSHFNTTNVTDIGGMFYSCRGLLSLNLSHFNTEKVTDMRSVFYECSSLVSLDLSSFNTANVTMMGTMFDLCSSLTSLDVSSFNTTNVESMPYMFANCDKLMNIDISSFNTANVKDMRYMFYSCPKLTTIYAGQDWSTAKVTNGNNMFQGCDNLIGGAGTTYNSSHYDYTYARIDEGTSKPGYFTDLSAKPAEGDPEPYAVLSNDNTALIFYYDDKKTERGGYDVGPFDYDSYEDKRWGGHDSDITTVVFDVSFANCTSITSTAFWFSDFNNLTTITGIEKLKTDNVTDMNSMFECCSSLTSLDLSHFNTTNVTTMAHMFRDCVVSSLDLSCFNTSNVTSMTGMFSGCSNLTTIYVGDGWTTKNITWGEFTFSNCHLLVGGSGTRYESDHNDYTYAHIDGGTANPGYLTKKDGSATGSCDMSEIPTSNAYYAATSFLCERGVLDGSKVDGKYLVEKPLIRKHLANISFRGLFTLKGREIPSTFVSDQYPDIYDDLKSDSSYYQAAKTLLYLDYGDGITPFDRDRDGFLPNGNEARINVLKELMEAFNIKSDMEGTDNPFPKDLDITSLSESSPIKMGYVRKAAKLGIITTENEQFRPYDDCLRGEAFLMLARIIQKIEAGEITDPNPQESDFLDPNSGTGTAEPYAVLSDDKTVLTFYYDDKKEIRGGLSVGPFSFETNLQSWREAIESITSVVFNASFANCTTLTSTAFWFLDFNNLTSITGIENLNTANVTNMYGMFANCSSLTSLDVSHFNTANVTNMYGMFGGCSGLTDLDLYNFNTENVTDMTAMFDGCSGLTSLDMSHFNTANVTDMTAMFQGCSNLTSLDLSSFNTAKVAKMTSMFISCSGLTTIYVGDSWTTASVTGGTTIFRSCTKLVGGKGTVFDSNHDDYAYAHIDGGADNPGYFTEKNATPVEDGSEPYAVLSDDNTVLTFYYDNKKESRGGIDINNTYIMHGSSSPYGTATTAIFDASFANYKPTSTAYWFQRCSSLTSITGMENLKTDNVTSMECMFSYCSSLTSLVLSNFNTASVTSMSEMFYGCSGLTSLDVSNFNTANVTNMAVMFTDCSKLTSLDVSNFNTANVTDMNGMFSGCSGLTSLDLINFNTANVTLMGSMFSGCSGLITIYVGNGWTTTSLTTGAWMFEGCTNLVGGAGTVVVEANNYKYTGESYAHIDGGESNPGYFTEKSATPVEDDSEPYAVLSNNNTVLTFYYDAKKESRGGLSVGPFKDENDRAWNNYRLSIYSVAFDESFANCTTLTSTAYWFYNCSSLTGITGISNLKTDHVTDMKFMFHGCESLTSIDVSGFKTDNVENIQGMFFRCELLTSMDLSGFNTEKVTNMSALFSRCVGLTSVDLSGFKTDLVTSMRLMFNQCSSLTSLNLTDFNTEKVTDMGYMFADCSSLRTIYVNNTGWNFSQLQDGTNMFENSTSLVGGAGTKFDTSHIDYTYAHIDGGTANPGYFTEKSATPVEDGLEPYAVFDNGSGTLTFYYDENKESRGGYDVGPFVLNEERWGGNSSYITTVVFDPSFAKCTSLTSTAYWFFECYYMTTIKGIENLKTGNVTDMSAMFYQCRSLTSLDLSNLDTRNVTNMMGMFMYCSELTSLNLMGFNTAKVTDMDCMFRSCTKLGSLLLSDFDTSNVTNMWCMFFDCPNLIALDVSSFNTGKVTNMSSMFQSCSKLTVIDVSRFNTSNVTDMGYMFSDCPSLKTIDVSSFDTKNVTNFKAMFYGCSELTTIYCNEAWSSGVESSQLFDRCEKLVGGKGTTYDADHKDATYARVDGGADAPGYFTSCSVVDENIEYKHGSGTGLVVYAAKDDTKELYIKGTVTVDDVTYPVTSIGESAFENNTVLEEVSIPATITLIGEKAFAGCINLKAIYVYIRIPVNITLSKSRTRGDGISTVFEGVDTETCTLYVPAGSGDSYRNAEGWSEFAHIVEMGETYEITIGKNGKTTFCGDMGLDFSGTDEVKAFIATGFDKAEGTIWMTRVKDVPAGVPVMIKGDANTTYDIPVTDGGTSYYKNMFVGNTSGESISISETSEDGKYRNYYMSGGQFKSVNGSANIGNNKCYLQLPATFEAETTGEALSVKIASSGKSSFAAPYDLDFTDFGDDLRAFTATGFDKSTSTVWLTRVKKVQKGEGLMLKGTGGETYTIPSTGVQSSYVNMIVGNISGETLAIGETAKNGTLTNYYLSGGTYKSVTVSANIGTCKSYLQLPTYMLAGARSEDAVNASDVQTTYDIVELETESMPLIFGSIGDGDDDTTGIRTTDCTDEGSTEWYDLQGRRVSQPTKKGLYIHHGRKVVIK